MLFNDRESLKIFFKLGVRGHDSQFLLSHLRYGGQAVIEYMLLLVIVAAMSAILIGALVLREEGNEGAIIKRWQELLQAIADDDPARADKIP